MSKILLGLILGFGIGIGCRYFDIPLPGPPRLIGALVVLSITCGYVGTDYLLVNRATNKTLNKKTSQEKHDGNTGIHCLPRQESGA